MKILTWLEASVEVFVKHGCNREEANQRALHALNLISEQRAGTACGMWLRDSRQADNCMLERLRKQAKNFLI